MLRVLTIFAIFYAASAVAIAMSDVLQAKKSKGGTEVRLAFIAGAVLVSGGLTSGLRDISSTSKIVVITIAAAVTFAARIVVAVHGGRAEHESRTER